VKKERNLIHSELVSSWWSSPLSRANTDWIGCQRYFTGTFAEPAVHTSTTFWLGPVAVSIRWRKYAAPKKD
jgi:hypothetical protein